MPTPPALSTPPAVSVEGLWVTYGSTTAVHDLSFEVAPGEVVALLGPNGAGKTSTLACLEGYRSPTQGSVRVLGLDPVAEHRALVPALGVMLQGGGLYPAMTPRDLLRLFASYYPNPRSPEELSELLGLNSVRTTPVKRLSGGEQQRLSLALALIGRPTVAFLDEPTAGVDPEGRLVIRAVVDALAAEGAAVVLTSHELAEVTAMAHRLVFLSHGRLLAQGTEDELTARLGPSTSFEAAAGLDLAELSALVHGVVAEPTPGTYTAAVTLDGEGIGALAQYLASQGTAMASLSTTSSLEELYLALYRHEGGEE